MITTPLLTRSMTLKSQPTATAALHEYRATAREWLAEHTSMVVPSEDFDARFQVLRAWQKTLYNAGYVGISLPKNWGGQGYDDRYAYVFTEELARAGLPAPIGLIGLDVVGPTLATYGTERQREELLPALLSGDDIWCQGFSEPGAGSDLAAISTRASLTDGAYRINGQKVWTSWGHYARRCALLARTGAPGERHRGLTYFIVDMSSPGITVRPIEQMTGDPEFCEIFFDDVEVSELDVIGTAGEGWSIAMDTLSHERATYAFRRRVESTAAHRAAATAISAHFSASETVAPDRLLAQLGRSDVALRVLEAQNLETLRRLITTPGPSPVDSVDKLVVNACEQQVFRGLYDWVGHAGAALDDYEYGLSTGKSIREYLYSRAASIYGGTAQVQRNIVANRGLGMARS